MAPFDMVLFAAEVVVLVGLSLAMLVPFVTHRRNVLYGEGVLLLVAALLFLTAGAVVEYVYWTGRSASWLVGGYGLYTLGTGAIAASMWYFARDFVGTVDRGEGREYATVAEDGDVGGFEDA